MGSQGVRPFWMRFLQLSFFPSFFFSVGFINWNLGFGRLTVETCSWFSPYWLRRELTRWLSKLPPQILNCKALMMTALLISLNLISITLYKEILSKAKLTIDFHCVQPNSSIRLHPSHHGDIFWTLNKRNFFCYQQSQNLSHPPQMELKWSLTAKSVCGWHFWAEERSPTYRGWICKFVNAQFTLYLVFVVFTMYKLDPGSISNFTKRIVRIKFPLPQWPPSKYSINYIAEVHFNPLRMMMLLKTSIFKYGNLIFGTDTWLNKERYTEKVLYVWIYCFCLEFKRPR